MAKNLTRKKTTKKEKTALSVMQSPLAESPNDLAVNRFYEMIQGRQKQMIKKWGQNYEGILPAEERKKFHQAWEWWDTAIASQRLEWISEMTDQLMRAFPAVEGLILANGIQPQPPDLWELTLENGMPVLFAKTEEDRSRAPENAVVFLANEIIILLDKLPVVIKAKKVWQKAELEKDTPFDDEIPFN
jgi:hypothetical protein